MGHRAGLNALAKRKIPSLLPPAIEPVFQLRAYTSVVEEL
jgi:hypothetical protein